MATRLRAMGIRDVLDNTFLILRERFWTFQGVIFFSFLPALLCVLTGVIYIGVTLSFFHAGWPFQINHFGPELFQHYGSQMIFLILLLFLTVLVSIVGSLFCVHGNIRIFKQGLLQQPCTVKEAFGGIGKKWFRYFLYWFFTFLLSLLITLLVEIFLKVLPLGSSLLRNGLEFIRFILQLCVSFLFCLTPVVIAVEEIPTVKALTRAFNLLKGHYLRVLGILIVTYILGYILTVVIMGITIVPIILAVRFTSAFWITLATVCGLGALFILSIMFSYYFGPLTAIYYDLLVRKEGYDLQIQVAAQSVLPQSSNKGIEE